MLTKRQNLLETIRGGNPDRFVNQYEALELIGDNPFSAAHPRVQQGETVVNEWGVTMSFPENVPGAFPVHDDVHIVLKDAARWREFVKAPSLDFPASEWEKFVPAAEAVDRREKFAALRGAPGIFEQLHYLMGMEGCMISFYTEPEAMHELIDYITDWKIEYAKLQCRYFHPDALFHHDDWGSQLSTFLSPEMFREFIYPAFKRLYDCYRENGVELIVHHSDSYAATLVPYMIDMGIDIWQGCLTTNNVPELIKKYGGKISFMGNINNGVIDRPDWTRELIAAEVERTCRECGKLYYIPCATMGGPNSVYEGVYETVSEEIDRVSSIMF